MAGGELGRRGTAAGESPQPLLLSQPGIVLKPDITHTAHFFALLEKQQIAACGPIRRCAFLDDFFRLRAWRKVLAGSTIQARTSPRIRPQSSPHTGPPAGAAPPLASSVRRMADSNNAPPSWSDDMNTMNTVRIAVAAAAALFAGSALAQSQGDDQQQASTPPAAQDTGGSPMSTSASGAPMAISHQQVYQDLVRAEQSGQLKALNQGLYHGN
jgi:hypothetical protein